MSPTSLFLLFLALSSVMITGVNSQCADPLVAYGNSTIAPIVLDQSTSTGTKFIPNPATTNVNNTRLLFVRLTWAAVSNRQLVYAGIGSTDACLPHIAPAQGQTVSGGWNIDNTSTTCFDATYASYAWPEALYAPDCAPYFTVSQSATEETISFDLIVQFIETYSIERAGLTYTIPKNITSKIPITLTFPTTVTVDSSAVTVFSASSVQINADLISQDITNSPPFTVSFITLNSRSFALNNPTASFNGTVVPASILVSFQADTIVSTTREDTWNIYITPEPTACTLSGVYNINFNLYWTGVDANGNPLAASQNPIPNNSSVQVSFTLSSQDFCATVFSQLLNSSMQIFGQAPDPTTYYAGVTPKQGFFTSDTVYFQTQVLSDNLPILAVSLIRLWITWGQTNQTDLVTNGTQSADDIDYAPSLTTQPNDQNMFHIVLADSVFQVLQDEDTNYVFHAQLGVSYSTTGQTKRKRTVMTKMNMNKGMIDAMLLMNNRNKLNSNNDNNNNRDSKLRRAQATTGSASVTTTAPLTLQTNAVTSTTASPTNVITTVKTSSSTSLVVAGLASLAPILFLML